MLDNRRNGRSGRLIDIETPASSWMARGSEVESVVITTQASAQASAQASELTARLGERVRAVRAARAMSRRQLAEESNISLPYLARVEKGDGNVSIGVLHKLALALNVPIENLVADTGSYGADYALIVELLKRQSSETLGEIRRGLVSQLSGPAECGPQGVRRVALIGMRGAGKSTLGQILAKRLALPFVELNKEIEAQAGIDLNEIFLLYGQAGFRRWERRCLERVIATYPAVVLATGGGLVTEPATYELLLHSFYSIWLRAEPEDHFTRVMAQHDIRIASTQLRKDAMENILQTLEARESLYSLAAARMNTSAKSVTQAAQELFQLLAMQEEES